MCLFAFLRYGFSYPESHLEEIERHLMEYRGKSIVQESPMIDVWSDLIPPLSLKTQFSIINAIPNFHKYPWEKLVKYLKHEQRVPTTTRVYPGSPRHRIIQAATFRQNSVSIIHDVLMNYAGFKTPVGYPPKAKSRRIVRFLINIIIGTLIIRINLIFFE